MSERFWILCGDPDHWSIALKDGIWGLIPKMEGRWKYLQQGDWLFFYASSPVKGVIGLGRTQAKFKQNKPLWPDEIAKKEVLYPFRFEFQPEFTLPQDVWLTKRIKITLPIGFYSGMNLLDDQNIIDKLTQSANASWNVLVKSDVSDQPVREKSQEKLAQPEVLGLSHDKVKDMVFEIGKMHRYITEKEYVINSDRLDVVWRRVEKSVPTYAFEIQVEGDVYHALSKLKHAYDIWNSNIYLVTDEKHRSKVEDLLSGTFHEIRNVLKIISLEQINSLHSLQVKDAKLRETIGLP